MTGADPALPAAVLALSAVERNDLISAIDAGLCYNAFLEGQCERWRALREQLKVLSFFPPAQSVGGDLREPDVARRLKDCTCFTQGGSCRGPEGLGSLWRCVKTGEPGRPARSGAETSPGSRIGQYFDLKAPMERPEGFLRHREDISGNSCLFCGDMKPWRLSPVCGATAEALGWKIEAVGRALVEERHAHPPDRPEIARLEVLLTRLRNRRDLVVLASEPQTRAGEDLRVPHYPED